MSDSLALAQQLLREHVRACVGYTNRGLPICYEWARSTREIAEAVAVLEESSRVGNDAADPDKEAA